MKISELKDAPQWLVNAITEEADVELLGGVVIWNGGQFIGGQFRGGEFCGGQFIGGEFCGGDFWGGEFRGGQFIGGQFIGGEWKVPEDRIRYMAAMLGIVFGADGKATAYRTTLAGGRGRYTSTFVQPVGEYSESDIPPAGSGTCVKGIHVSSAATAYTYLGIDRSCEMWRVTFTREQLLDCDGQKARISGGFFEKIERPF